MVGYGSSIKKFDCIQKVAMWAGFIGMGQALLWMGLTITGILSYNCQVSAYDKLTFGSLISQTFLDLYFTGDCLPPNFKEYNNLVLKSVPVVFSPMDILIWECVYLGVAFLWCVSSILIVTNLKKDNRPATAGLLLTWVFITLAVCLMDLALGISFGVDYGNFFSAGLEKNFDTAEAGFVDPLNAELIAGAVVAMSLMIISFKGFIFWIVNMALLIYLAIKAFEILNDTDSNDTLFMPHKSTDDVLSNRAPISAYEDLSEYSRQPVAFDNNAYVPDTRSVGTVEVNQEALNRAARMSNDITLQDHRFRNLDAFQQYPPARANSFQPKSQKSITESTPSPVPVSAFPAPDYSPPMIRANQGNAQNGQMRSTRY